MASHTHASALDFSSVDAKRAFIVLANTTARSKEEEAVLAEASDFWESEFGDTVIAANDDVAPRAHPDRPLSFHWKVDREAVARTGYQLTGDKDDDRCMRAMMADLVLAGRAGEAVSYSRNQDFYRATRRYAGIPYAYGRIKMCVEVLLQLGLITEDRKKPGAHRRKIKLQSSMRATQKLLDAFAGVAPEFDPVEVIRLRDAKGQQRDYDETGKTIAMRREMDGINEFVRSSSIELPDDDVVRRGDLLLVDGAAVRIGPLFFYRSFCRCSFVSGGRLYWFGQNVPKERRKHFLLDGQPVCELDFKSMHIDMLYAQRGVRMAEDFDPYDLPDVKRVHAKLALLVIINARTRRQAICALIHATLKDGSKWPYDFTATADLIDRIIERNPVIADDICSDKGVRLMYDDSEIAIRIVKACMKKGIVCLPIHDSFIVQERHREALAAIMKDEMERYRSRVAPAKKQVVSSGNINGIVVSSLTEGDGALPPSSGSSVLGLAASSRSSAPRGPRLLPKGLSWPVRVIDRTDYFSVDARGIPAYDQVESARRQAAWEVARASDPRVEYFPVPGETEYLLACYVGRGWKRAASRTMREAQEAFYRGEISVPPMTMAERAANCRLPEVEGGSGWGLKKAAA